jgi:hypothetical protein
MFNRYKRCCCQNKYSPEIIESLCNDVGTTADYVQDPVNSCGCGCNNMMNSNSCGCGFDEEPISNMFPSNPMLGQSYVPLQEMDKTFTTCCGLKMGTIFPELVSPYMPGQSMAENDYLRRTNEIGEGCNG